MASLHFEKGSMKNQPIVIASVSEAISGWRCVCKLASSSYFKPGTLLTLLPRTILNLVMLAWLVIVFYNANETTTPHLLIPSQRGKGNSFFWASEGVCPMFPHFPSSPSNRLFQTMCPVCPCGFLSSRSPSRAEILSGGRRPEVLSFS